MTDEDAIYEHIVHVVNAFMITTGTLVVELDRAGAIDRSRFTDLLRRKVFDAEETGADATRPDLRYIRLLMDAIENEPR